ncbi:MAG TPA: hypothetical protein VMI10_10610 [Terriglobales bacterium]|nr:hypothetical protein [Terriglobales bacterium]
MTDSRSPQEIDAIRNICAAHDIDPANMLGDSLCDLAECGRRVNMILAVRAGMRPTITSTVRH